MEKRAVDLEAELVKAGARENLLLEKVGDLEARIEWWREQQPRWYEKPAFVAGVTAVVVIYAVLRAVQVSLD